MITQLQSKNYKSDIDDNLESNILIIGSKTRQNKVNLSSIVQKDNITPVVITGNIFSYKGNAIDVLFDKSNDPWFRSLDICKILEYKHTSQTIRINVSNENKKSLGLLIANNIVSKEFDTKHKDTLYINHAGLFQLLLKSKMSQADEFKKWIACDVLVSIDKTGKYDIYNDSDIPVSFYSDNFIFNLDGKRVIYIGYCGKINNEYIYKFGITSDLFRRDYDELSRAIPGFKIIYAKECLYNDDIEKLLDKELILRNLKKTMKFNGKKYSELFITSDDMNIEKIKKLIDLMIDNKTLNESILPEKYNYQIELEKTKRLQLIIKFIDELVVSGEKNIELYKEILNKLIL
jgi:hypothetical protein